MITGSKFYQAPPFCGAMLVNKSFLKQLEGGDYGVVPMFKELLSAYDFPKFMRDKTGLDARQNIGLRLRWACFLNERKKFMTIPEPVVNDIIDRWNTLLSRTMMAHEEFELMPDQFRTNRTIISFRLKKNGNYFGAQLV